MSILRAVVLTVALLSLSACVSSNMMASSALKSGEIRLSKYKYAVITQSRTASFIELELESLLESNGLEVIGSADGKKYGRGTVILARYAEEHQRDGYGSVVGTTITVTLEDMATDKTLLTVNGRQSYLRRDAAWKQVSEELAAALKSY
jgi:hypothetical protein